MIDDVRTFLFESLVEMNYSTDDLSDDSPLGPAGADLESLALAELAVRVEDRFGVKFNDDEAEQLASLTIGEFCATVASRVEPATSK